MEANATVVPKEEIHNRIGNLQEELRKKGIDGGLIIQKTDLFYFAATAQQGWLYVPAEGDALLMIFKDVERAAVESPLPVISLASPKKIPDVLQERGCRLPTVLGMELDVLPANLYFQYADIFKGVRVVDISTEVRLIRAIKSEYEIGLLREAAALSDKVSAKVPEILREGMTEVELAGQLEAYARSLGHQGIVRMRLWGSELFYGHLLSGSDAAIPSYLASPTGGAGVSPLIGQGAGFKKIARNEPVLVDYVFAWQGYISDHARIFSLGPLPDDLMQAHAAMRCNFFPRFKADSDGWTQQGKSVCDFHRAKLLFRPGVPPHLSSRAQASLLRGRQRPRSATSRGDDPGKMGSPSAPARRWACAVGAGRAPVSAAASGQHSGRVVATSRPAHEDTISCAGRAGR